MIKVTVLYGQPKDPETFEKYHKQTHLPLAAKMKGVERLELTRFVPGSDGVIPTYYRMAELYFADEEQLNATFNSPEGSATVSDLSNFATGGVTILTGLVGS